MFSSACSENSECGCSISLIILMALLWDSLHWTSHGNWKTAPSDMVDKFSVMGTEHSTLQVHVQYPQEAQSQITVRVMREDMSHSPPPEEPQIRQELSWPGQEGCGWEGPWIHFTVGNKTHQSMVLFTRPAIAFSAVKFQCEMHRKSSMEHKARPALRTNSRQAKLVNWEGPKFHHL